MATGTPSLYPKPMQPTNSSWSAAGGPSPSAAHMAQETLPSEYEVLLEVPARLTEVDPPHATASEPVAPVLSKPFEATLRVIQGPRPPSSPDEGGQTSSYHAFISIESVNIPLLPMCTASRPGASSFHVTIPKRAFVIDIKGPAASIATFESHLRWFCKWQSGDGRTSAEIPTGTTLATGPPSGPVQSAPAHSQPGLHAQHSSTRIATAGDKGVELVERYGTALQNYINRTLEQRRDAVPEGATREVKMGGKVTSGLLSTTRKVVGAGATVASKLTGKISTAVGSRLADNAATRNMSNAPEGSAKRNMYENLSAGLLAFGRVYVAADAKGKVIIEDAGERAEQIASRKYGSEAASASRNITGIALDGYRIARFPQKLGASAIIKGAVKSRMPPASAGAGGGPAGPTNSSSVYDANMQGWNDVSEDDVGAHLYPPHVGSHSHQQQQAHNYPSRI